MTDVHCPQFLLIPPLLNPRGQVCPRRPTATARRFRRLKCQVRSCLLIPLGHQGALARPVPPPRKLPLCWLLAGPTMRSPAAPAASQGLCLSPCASLCVSSASAQGSILGSPLVFAFSPLQMPSVFSRLYHFYLHPTPLPQTADCA